jgi:hypothetical protein
MCNIHAKAVVTNGNATLQEAKRGVLPNEFYRLCL